MYEELIAVLRHCGSLPCEGCPRKTCEGAMANMREAADAIEELNLVAESNERSAARWAETAGKAVEQIPRWIPVTERLPDAYEDVLLKFTNNQAAGFVDRDGCWGVYSGDGFYTEVADNEPKPTHWMKKLPEPPKEEA